MSTETSIQTDLRALLVAALPGVPVYDTWVSVNDPNPYITFGEMQVVQNHTKGYRFHIYYVTIDLFVRDASGSITARDMGATIRDTLDRQKLTTSELDCYFEDSTAIYEPDALTTHVVLHFQVR